MGVCIDIKREYLIYAAIVVIIVAGIAAYFLFINQSGNCSACGKQVSKSYIQKLSAVANNYSLANQVGAGIVQLSGPYANLPQPINASPLVHEGKPEVLYIGGDFCPYCAISRWGLIIALMRFGNFSELTYMESNPTDVYPNTATFSFTNYTYSSNLLYFSGVEVYDRAEKPFNVTLSPADQSVYSTYDTNGIPFMDFENVSIQSGANISPQIIKGYTWNQVLADLGNPNSVVAQAIIGNANYYTAQICKNNQTLNETATACKQSYVSAIIG